MKRVFLLLILVLMTSMTSASLVDFTDSLADKTQLKFNFTNQLADKTVEPRTEEPLPAATIQLGMILSAGLADKPAEDAFSVFAQGLADKPVSEVLVEPQFDISTAFAQGLADENKIIDLAGLIDPVKVNFKGNLKFNKRTDNLTDIEFKKGKVRAYLKGISQKSIGAVADNYENRYLTTPVFAANASVEIAEVSLPKNGYVNAILKCDDFDVDNFVCTGSWENSLLPFVDNGTHVIFNATSFSGFGGGNITIITVQSYPIVGGNWVVKFNTTGTDNLTIRASNGTTWSLDNENEDLKFLEVKCGNTTQNYTWINNSVFIENYSCDNVTSTETSKVLTRGKHTIAFTFGMTTVYAFNIASNIGTVAQIYDQTFGQNGDTTEIALSMSNETALDSPYNHTENANLTINEDGWYKISYGVTWISTGATSRHIMRNWINQNDVQVNPSETRCYVRDTEFDRNKCSNSAVLLVNASAGDYINLMGTKDHGQAGVTETASDVWLYAQKVEREVAQTYDPVGDDDEIINSSLAVDLSAATRVDPIYTHTGNTTTVTEAGLYKIYYTLNSQLNDTNTVSDRRIIKTLIQINGVNLTPSEAFSYIRDEINGDQNHNTGFVIANLSANDDIQLITRIEIEEEPRIHVVMGNLTWMLVEKVNDSDILQVYEAVGGQSVAENAVDPVDFDTNQFIGESFHRPSENNITFNASGWYEISYGITWDDLSTGDRRLVSTFIRHNGQLVNTSNQTDYSRGINDGSGEGRFQSNAANFILNVTEGDSIQLFMSSIGGISETEPNADWLTIIPVRVTPALVASVLTPTPNAVLPVVQNTTFDFNVTVTCDEAPSGSCGVVNILAQYNATQGEPETNMSSLLNETPFVILESIRDNEIIVALQSTTNELRLYEFTNGAWREAINITDQPGGIEALDIGDADNDGLNEIVIGVDSDNQVKIVDWDAAANSWSVTDVSGSQAWHIEDLEIGDADNDGRNEIIAGFERTSNAQPNSGITSVRMYDFETGAWTETNVSVADSSVQWVDIGDIDDDGLNEVVALYANVTGDSPHLSRVTVYENSTSPWIQINVTDFLGGVDARAERMQIGDIDNDGKDEIIASFWDDDGTTPEHRITLYQNDTSATYEPINISVGAGLIDGIDTGDVDDDGLIELLVTNDLTGTGAGPNQVVMHQNVSGFYAATNISEQLTGLGRDVSIGDANNDGKVDAVGTQDQPLILYENISRTQINTTIQTFTVDIDSADIVDADNDGRLNNITCGTMNTGDVCQINYTIKATGGIGTFWFIDINATSSTLATVDSSNPTIHIVGVGIANITQTKEASPEPVNTSGLLTYTINATNVGTKTAFNATVVDTYPDEVIFQSAEPTPEAGTNNTFFIGNLTSTQRVQINITVLVNNITNGTIINNTANVTFLDEDNVSFNDVVIDSTTVIESILSVNITTNATSVTVVPAANATYLITVGNNGTLTNTYNLTVQNLNSADTAVINQSIIILEAGQTGTVLHTVRHSSPGEFNTTVTAIEAGQPAINETTAIITTTVIDINAPAIRDVIPIAPEFNNTDIFVNISANVTDDIAVDFVRVNITLPNGSTRLLTMTDPNIDSVYNVTFSETPLTGLYNISILANDTSNNNETVTTFFTILAPLSLTVDADKDQYGQGASAVITVNATDNASSATIADVTTDIIFGNTTIPQPAPWLNASLARRIPFNITERSGTELQGFVVNFTIDTATLISDGNMRSDCGDVRFGQFTDNITKELLYEIFTDTCNTSTTMVHVGLPPTLAASGSRLVFMYFDNSSITSASNESVFDISDNVTKYALTNNLATAPLRIISYVDNNNISVNGTEVAILDRGEAVELTTAQWDNDSVITGTGPFDGVWNSTATGDNLAPQAYAGTDFVMRYDRGIPDFQLIAPFGEARVVFYNGSDFNPVVNTTISQGVFSEIDVLGFGIGNGIIIESNESIIVRWEDGTANDFRIVYPAETELWGVPAGSLELAALENDTNISVLMSSGTNRTYNLTRGQTIEDVSFATEGNSDAVHIIANRPFDAFQEADGDGSEASTFLPERELNREYFLPLPASYVAISATQPETNCTMFQINGSNLTLTSTAQPRPFGNKILFGSGGTADDIEFLTNSRLLCDAPVYAYFEMQPTDAQAGEETNLYGTKSGRQLLRAMPNASTLPETQLISRDINATNATTGQHIFTFDTSTQSFGNYTVVTAEGKFFSPASDSDTFEIILNFPPVVENVTLQTVGEGNFSTENLTVTFNATDNNSDSIKNITNYFVNNESLLTLNMPFEGGSNSTFTRDYTNFSRNGTVENATFLPDKGYDGGGAYNFSGLPSDGVIMGIPNATINRTTGTIEVWARPESFATTQMLVWAGTAGANGYGGQQELHLSIQHFNASLDQEGFTFWYGDAEDGTPGLDESGGALNWTFLFSGNLTGTEMSWQHVVVTWNLVEGTTRMYLNGSLVDEDNITGEFYNSNIWQDEIRIGRPGAVQRSFNGTLDEIRIYDRELSTSQIFALYNNRTTTIVLEETKVDDVWQACVTPNDGTEDGTEVCSNNVSIKAAPVNVSNLTVIKTDSLDPVNVSSNLSYTINVTSTGNKNASNVTVNDTYPPEVIFLAAEPTPLAGTNSTFILGNMTPNSSILVNITVFVTNVSNNTVLENIVNVTFDNITGGTQQIDAIETTTVIKPPGILNIFQISPESNVTTSVEQNLTFLTSVNITCTDTGASTCGNVTAFARHNATVAGGILEVFKGEATTSGVETTVSIGSEIKPDNSVLFFSVREDSSTPTAGHLSGRIMNNTHLLFTQLGSVALPITWYVASFKQNIRVYRNFTESNSTLIVPIGGTINPNQSFLIPGGFTQTSSAFSNDDFIQYHIFNATHVGVRVADDAVEAGDDADWQVVEFNGSFVQRGMINMTSRILTENLTTPTNTTRSFLTVSYLSSGGTLPAATFNILGRIVNSTQIEFVRNGTVGFTPEIAWEVVELPAPATVQHNVAHFNASEFEVNVTLTSVNTTRAVAFASTGAIAGLSMGNTSFAANDTPGHGMVTLNITNSTNLKLTRLPNGSVASIGWFVVEFTNDTSEGFVPISTTDADAPFFTTDLNPQNCILGFNETCTLNWTVNATGNISEEFKINVNASSNESDVSPVVSEFGTIQIVAPVISVVGLSPGAGTQFLLNETVNITANVTTRAVIDSVLANVTLPNGTVIVVTLVSGSTDIFNGTVSGNDLTLRGQYNITFFANDTNGNINATTSTNFVRNALDVIDIRMQALTEGAPPTFVFANYTTTVVSNVSGILNLSISLNNTRITQINVSLHDETSFSSILDLDDWEPARSSSTTYAIDPARFNFTEAVVMVNASGEVFRKCANWSFANRDCLGAFEIQQNITQGQLYTFTLNATDPGFLETSPAVDVALAPFDNQTFVIAFIRNDTNQLVFKVMNTTGVEIVGETVVDSTVDTDSRVSVWPINSTHFAIGWIDGPSNDATRAIYFLNGSVFSAASDLNTGVGLSTDISIAQLGDRFSTCYVDDSGNDALVQQINNTDNSVIVSDVFIDGQMRPQLPLQNLFECAGINSTRFAAVWFDDAGNDVSFSLLNETSGILVNETDVDTNAGETAQVAVTAVDNDKFALAWYDTNPQDITMAIYDSDGVQLLAPTDIDNNAGNESRVAMATVKQNSTATADSFVVAYWNDNTSTINAAVFNGTGGTITSSFVVDTQPNANFRLFDVTGRDVITNNSICPGKFVVAYSNSTDQGIFKGFDVDGTSWDGVCEVGQPDIVVVDTQIFFNDSHPRENQNITINATINNTGTASASSVVVQFFDNTSGVQIGSDFTITSIAAGGSVVVNQTYISIIGNRTILVAADPANTITESDETNNNATAQLNVQAHTIFFGKILGNLTLSTDSSTFYNWNATDAGILYFYDNDSNFNFSALQALGFNTTNGTSFGDFAELDALLNMTNFNDSVTDLWASDNSTAVDVRNFTVFGRRIDKVPVLSSTVEGTFVTGILWDTEDDTNEEFDFAEHEDIVFITNINLSQSGASGSDIDYEIRVPSLMRGYQPSQNIIAFQSEIR